MSEKTKHSPLPWRIEGEVEVDFNQPIWYPSRITKFQIYAGHGLLCNPATCKIEANAELIVRAVNSHEALVSACELVLKEIGDWPEPNRVPLEEAWIRIQLTTVDRITKAVRAAMDKAKETQ